MIVIPPAPLSVPLSASLSVSLTESEKDQVAATAKAAGLSMSAYARRRIVG